MNWIHLNLFLSFMSCSPTAPSAPRSPRWRAAWTDSWQVENKDAGLVFSDFLLFLLVFLLSCFLLAITFMYVQKLNKYSASVSKLPVEVCAVYRFFCCCMYSCFMIQPCLADCGGTMDRRFWRTRTSVSSTPAHQEQRSLKTLYFQVTKVLQ